MNKIRTVQPSILVFYNQIQSKEAVFRDFKTSVSVTNFIHFSESGYSSWPENPAIILFADTPDSSIFARIAQVYRDTGLYTAVYKNELEKQAFENLNIHRLINHNDPGKSKSEKLELFIELFQKEKEILDLSNFVEVGHQKTLEQRTKIKLLSSTVNEPILIATQDKKITLWNREAQSVFGYSKYEVIQENFLDLIISHRSREQVEKLFSDVLTGTVKNAKMNQPIFVRNKLGVEFEINASVSTHKNKSKSYNFVFVFHDIQKAKKLEREILRNRDLWEETKILKEFVHHVTHELRTPMNSIIGIAKAIRKYNAENLSDRQKEGLKIIIYSGEQLVNLIKDLLDIARMDKNKIELNHEVFSLDKVLSLLKSQTLQLIDDKPVKFLIKKSPTVPSSLYGDHRKIIQVLTNLVGNAVKFTNQGKIVLSSHFVDKKLFFEVSDTGIGIRPEKQKEIFQKFTQAESAFSSIGTGLGLHISRKLVQLMRGEITIESEFEKGTIVRFYVSLPASPEEKNATKGIHDKNDIRLLNFNPRNKLILVIDDNLQNHFTYRLIAENDNFNILLINNGKLGMQAIREFYPDLILLKVEIPGLHGASIFKEIKNMKPQVPVILISEMDTSFSLPGAQFNLPDPLNYDNVSKLLSEIKKWPKKHVWDRVVVFDSNSWLEKTLLKKNQYLFIKNINPELVAVRLSQLKINTLIIENLSSSSTALNLAIRTVNNGYFATINEIILHSEASPLKLLKDKALAYKQVKILNRKEILGILKDKYVTEG
jgi:PAS domain S-box-containing protein